MQVYMLRAIDGFARSTDRAALSMDRSVAQQSIDRAARSEDAHAVVAPTDSAALRYRPMTCGLLRKIELFMGCSVGFK